MMSRLWSDSIIPVELRLFELVLPLKDEFDRQQDDPRHYPNEQITVMGLMAETTGLYFEWSIP